MDDHELLERQSALQREAAAFVERIGLLGALARAGRVVPLGSAVTGLMVWRDLDFGVEAPGLTAGAAWETMLPVLVRSSSTIYLDDREERRHYFVLRIEDWKVDVSVWTTPLPPDVEAFQRDLVARLDDDLRLAVLRLKDAWYASPAYPETVSAWQIYDAAVHHRVRTLDELGAYLAERGYPAYPDRE